MRPQHFRRQVLLAAVAGTLMGLLGCGSIPEAPPLLDADALPANVELTVPVGEAAVIPSELTTHPAVKEMLQLPESAPSETPSLSADNDQNLPPESAAELANTGGSASPPPSPSVKPGLTSEEKALLSELKLQRSAGNAFRIDQSRVLIYEPRDVEPTPPGQAVLKRLAQVLSQCDHVAIHVIGHTDARYGTAAANQRLSEQRARWVANYLVGNGVPQKRIRSEGRGGTERLVKVDDVLDTAGREKNRRVDIVLKPIISGNEAAAWQPLPTPYR